MNDRAQIPPQLLLTLGALRDKAMAADSLNALAFSIANDAYPLLRFRQVLVFAQRAAFDEAMRQVRRHLDRVI